MQRPAKILQQKADRNQIEEDTECARDAVVRNAALAVHIADWNFTDRSAMPRCQRRNEPVQLAIERYLLQNFTPIRLESGAKVVNIDSAQLCHQPVGAAGGEAAQP